MTVICGIKDKGNIYMGCDSAISTDSEIMTLSNPKIIRKWDMLIGITGSMRGLQLLEYEWVIPNNEDGDEILKVLSTYFNDEYIYKFVVPSIKEVFFSNQYCVTYDGQENMEDWLLIGYKGELYTVVSNYQCFKLDKPYAAIGSGSSYALGSFKTQEDFTTLGIDPEGSIKMAIKSACEFSNSVREPIRIFKI